MGSCGDFNETNPKCAREPIQVRRKHTTCYLAAALKEGSMRKHLQPPEGLLSGLNPGAVRSKLNSGPLGWCIIVLLMLLFLTPYAFADSINKALGIYAK